MKSVKHLWASLLIVMAFVIICPSALAATGNSSQVHSENPVDAYPNSTIGVIHFYIDDGIKDNAKEVSKGMDCGLTLENCQDYKENDQIEVYDLVEVKR